MSRQNSTWMLAKRRSLKLGNVEVERTPLLVPSFSSKGFKDAQKIITTTEEVIDGPILISAYDIYHKHIKPPFEFPSLIFIDSGGYEATKDMELSDFGEREHKPQKWSLKMHEVVIHNWTSSVPNVFISYDHPNERCAVVDQIDRANSIPLDRSNVIREILLKPETQGQALLKIDNAIEHIEALADFDIIGVTEKEVGNSILNRMENIAKLRRALDKINKDTLIHVFGSLDTLTTPLYYLAGADIFDGLTWLRFAYHKGYTMYKHNYGAIKFGVSTFTHIIDARTWFDNYRYLVDLQLEMRRFLNNNDFTCFKHHADLFQNAHENMIESVGDIDGR